MKVIITCKNLAVLLLLILFASCSTMMEGPQSGRDHSDPGLKNNFAVAPQVTPPAEIQSLQLFREGSASNPPVIHLKKKERLILKFDHLKTETRQFKVEVRHYSSNWEESALNPEYYLEGFYEDYFSGGQKSYTQRPSYRHYEYEFPNRQLSFSVSGNYLLSIFDADTNELLFSLPFFVTEDEGSLQTRVEKLFAQRDDLRQQDQLFGEYRYPPFVELPRFDLSFVYVQNQFWGRARHVRFFDTSSPGLVNFHLSRDEAFLGDYEFKTVDLRSFPPDGQQILSYQPEDIPPTILLRRDIQNLSPVPAFDPGPRFGLPVDDRNARYANVQFQLDAASADSLQRIYLIGDFNGWTINEFNRMEFNATTQLWEGSALIKQGEYAYKYVVLDRNRIDDLALDRSYTFRSQNYTTLIYFQDPSRHYDRLLKVGFTKN